MTRSRPMHPQTMYWDIGPYQVKQSFDQRIPCNGGHARRYRPPKTEQDQYCRSPKAEVDEDMPDVATRMGPLRLNDYDSITAYLKERLELLQQQALKRLAKTWIKSICPKKQARFPYRSKQQKEDGAESKIPVWWPFRECPFTEPDHVDKQARTALCMHIIRLRPSREDLEEWQRDLEDPTEMHRAAKTPTWTGFLQDSTQKNIFDALGKTPEPEEKLRLRQKVLDQMWYVAAAEEAYIKGERDGNDVLYVEADDDAVLALAKKSQPKKRSRDVPGAKASNADGRTYKKGKVVEGREVQRKRRAPTVGIGNSYSKQDEGYSSCALTYSEMDAMKASLFRSSKARNKCIKPMRIIQMHQGGSAQSTHPFFVDDAFLSERTHNSASSSENSPLTASFGSSLSSQDDMNYAFRPHETHPNFHGRTQFKYEEPTHDQRPIQVHNVTAIPQPHFETVPNTPVASPKRFAQFLQRGGWSEEYPFSQPMERYPARISTPIMPAFTMPPPVCQPPMAHPIPQYAPSPIVEASDQRSATPGSDAHSVYGGYPAMEFGEQAIHGLPMTHRHDSFPNHDDHGQHMPFTYAEDTPDQDFPAGTLPGSVVRGFTGYASGVGETLVKDRLQGFMT